jgi:hypothetical protein
MSIRSAKTISDIQNALKLYSDKYNLLRDVIKNKYLTVEMLTFVLNYEIDKSNNIDWMSILVSLCNNKSLTLDLLKCLVIYMKNINCTFKSDKYAITPLHDVCRNESITLDILKYVIEITPDDINNVIVYFVDSNYDSNHDYHNVTPLYYLFENPSATIPMYTMMIDNGANFMMEYDHTHLMLDILCRCITDSKLDFIIEHGDIVSLHRVVEYNNIAQPQLKKLMENGLDLNHYVNGCTPLHHLYIFHNKIDLHLLKFVIENCGNLFNEMENGIDTLDTYGLFMRIKTPIMGIVHNAFYKNAVHVLKYLIETKIIDAKFMYFERTLIDALFDRSFKRYMLGPDEFSSELLTLFGCYELFNDCNQNITLDILKSVVSNGISLNTVLHRIFDTDHIDLEIIKFLIENKCDLSNYYDGIIPDVDAAVLLIDKNIISLNTLFDGKTLLHVYFDKYESNLESFPFNRFKKYDVQVQDSYGCTILHKLCQSKHITLKTLKLFLQHIDISICDMDNATCLHYLCRNESTTHEMLRIIWVLYPTRRSCWTIKTKINNTVLSYMCRNQKINIIKLQFIVENLKLDNSDYSLAIHHLCENRSITYDVLELLILHTNQIHYKCLMTLVQNPSITHEMLSLLLQCNLTIDITFAEFSKVIYSGRINNDISNGVIKMIDDHIVKCVEINLASFSIIPLHINYNYNIKRLSPFNINYNIKRLSSLNITLLRKAKDYFIYKIHSEENTRRRNLRLNHDVLSLVLNKKITHDSTSAYVIEYENIIKVIDTLIQYKFQRIFQCAQLLRYTICGPIILNEILEES